MWPTYFASLCSAALLASVAVARLGDPHCRSCDCCPGGCLWEAAHDNLCFMGVTEEYCTTWTGNTWCGAGPTAMPTQYLTEAPTLTPTVFPGSPTSLPTPDASKPCSDCSQCTAVPGNPQHTTDDQCAPCAMGAQPWWPCLSVGLCQCGGSAPTHLPTPSPTPSSAAPTPTPTVAPTLPDTLAPTMMPTNLVDPTSSPTFNPTATPTLAPTVSPETRVPTSMPTKLEPTSAPTLAPTVTPTPSPTPSPETPIPTVMPTLPTVAPTLTPTTPFSPAPTPIGGDFGAWIQPILTQNELDPQSDLLFGSDFYRWESFVGAVDMWNDWASSREDPNRPEYCTFSANSSCWGTWTETCASTTVSFTDKERVQEIAAIFANAMVEVDGFKACSEYLGCTDFSAEGLTFTAEGKVREGVVDPLASPGCQQKKGDIVNCAMWSKNYGTNPDSVNPPGDLNGSSCGANVCKQLNPPTGHEVPGSWTSCGGVHGEFKGAQYDSSGNAGCPLGSGGPNQIACDAPPATCHDFMGNAVTGSSEKMEKAGCFYGRGVVQLTTPCNYGAMSYYTKGMPYFQERSSSFCAEPDLLCDDEVSAWIGGIWYWISLAKRGWVENGRCFGTAVNNYSPSGGAGGHINTAVHPPVAVGTRAQWYAWFLLFRFAKDGSGNDFGWDLRFTAGTLVTRENFETLPWGTLGLDLYDASSNAKPASCAKKQPFGCVALTPAVPTPMPTVVPGSPTSSPTPDASKPCAECSQCTAVPGNPQSATDEQCAPCAMGVQAWWPCLAVGLCQCGGSAPTHLPTHSPTPSSAGPTPTPTLAPTLPDTVAPTMMPTSLADPTPSPTPNPTATPTLAPTPSPDDWSSILHGMSTDFHYVASVVAQGGPSVGACTNTAENRAIVNTVIIPAASRGDTISFGHGVPDQGCGECVMIKCAPDPTTGATCLSEEPFIHMRCDNPYAAPPGGNMEVSPVYFERWVNVATAKNAYKYKKTPCPSSQEILP